MEFLDETMCCHFPPQNWSQWRVRVSALVTSHWATICAVADSGSVCSQVQMWAELNCDVSHGIKELFKKIKHNSETTTFYLRRTFILGCGSPTKNNRWVVLYHFAVYHQRVIKTLSPHFLGTRMLLLFTYSLCTGQRADTASEINCSRFDYRESRPVLMLFTNVSNGAITWLLLSDYFIYCC